MKFKLPESIAWLPDEVLGILEERTGEMVTKRTIAFLCGLPYNKTTDRYVREVANQLRSQGHPIISTSGQAGYSYDPERVEEIIADLHSRIIDMSATIKALERGYVKNKQMELIDSDGFLPDTPYDYGYDGDG